MSSRILEQIGSSEDENFIGVEIDKESGGRNIEGNSGRSGKFSQVQLELIRECFDFFDRSMKDSLDVKVIPEAIRSLGIPIRHEEISTLLAQAVVSESTAEVPFNVFLGLVEKLLTIQSLPEFLELQEMQLKESFDALDHDNDGILEIEELIRIIGIWEKNMSENELRKYLAEFQIQQKGIDYPTFKRILKPPTSNSIFPQIP